MIIIFFGKPGSGKDTQADLYAKKHKLEIINMGKLIREDQNLLSSEDQAKVNSGILLEDSVIEEIFNQKVKSLSVQNIIIDGFPRTIHQAKMLLNSNSKIIVYNLNISDSESETRLLKRKQIEGRLDDEKEVISRRLQEYKIKTQPIIDLFIDYKVLENIDGERPIEEIANEIESNYRHKIS